jgi:hypothetical protein
MYFKNETKIILYHFIFETKTILYHFKNEIKKIKIEKNKNRKK